MSVSGRKALLGVVACAVMGFAVTGRAADKTAYLSLSGGVNFPSGDLKETNAIDNRGAVVPDFNISLDTGWDASVGIGAYLDRFRIEGQYTVQYNKFDQLKQANGLEGDANGALHSNLFMLNVYYDIPVANKLSIYVGGGAGALYATHEGDAVTPDTTWTINHMNGTSFAYQGMAGLEYQLSPIMSVYSGYRGWSATNVNAQQLTMHIPWFNMVEVGLRVSF